MTTKTLTFYTTGEGLTNLLRDLIQSGEFERVNTILSKQLPLHEVKAFYEGKRKFVGTAKNGQSLDFVTTEQDKSAYEAIYIAINKHLVECLCSYGANQRLDSVKELQPLLTIFSVDEILDIVKTPLLESYKYYEANPLELCQNGVILEDGTYIETEFAEHDELYRLLYFLKLASSSQWTDCTKTIHISSGQLSGPIGYSFDDRDSEEEITEEQIKTLFRFRESLRGKYADSNHHSMVRCLLSYIEHKTNKGGKFNNLTFLKYFYQDRINLPNFSLNREDIQGDKVFIRTSPKKSLPGLLNSRIINNTKHDETKAVNFIQYEFDKYLGLLGEERYSFDEKGKPKKKIIDDNKLHYFFQEFIEGSNGVCHYEGKNTFAYEVSDKQGDIVRGVKSDQLLKSRVYDELRSIARDLYNDLQIPIQIEFVVDKNDKLYIVQLRELKNHFERTVILSRPEASEIIAKGQTFSKGHEKVKVEDILIIDSDGESKLLLGKKALIVKSDVQFSHLLALSKALNIPSIFNTGEVDLSSYDEVDFCAYNKKAWISKITE